MISESAASLRSRYVVQAASDLEENRRRQQELAGKIKVLRQEEALLLDILSLAERYEASEDSSPLPEQPQAEPVPARRGPRTDSAQGPAGPSGRGGGPGSKAKAAVKGKPKQAVLLGDILLELLAAHSEPRPAKELREELLERHPDREPTPQVVRNTLESLVAKAQVRRHKQERSVMYTLLRADQGGA
ncbi:hypothetical protein GCM10009760_54190 [Kitasatospora kazusensis]|uniref:Penicillinase repressor n=1 Tax=Kitasatospora kazusensis TaxID=407974 RepID=A0ABP5LVM5_9ACTN